MLFLQLLEQMSGSEAFSPAVCLLSTSFLLSLKLEEMVEAEDALSEANALNNTNAEVWGYLALICLQVSAQPASSSHHQPDRARSIGVCS